MTSSVVSQSSISDIHKLIESHNPFDRSLAVRSHDIWEHKFPDVPSINGHISDAIFNGIEQIRSGQRSVLGVTITAEKGLGKSHLISRLRRRIKSEGGSFFVYMSETDYADLNQINSMFLATLAQSLKQIGSQGVTQWQELATLLVNEVSRTNYSTEHLVKRLPGTLTKEPNFLTKLTERICQIKPDITDPYVIQAILWTLSSNLSPFAINWLSGRELGQAQADAMGLPNAQREDSEKRALGIAGQVLDLIGDYRTIVICLDEVEPKSSNSKGLSTPQVVALLAKDLYSKIRRGVLIMAIYPITWAYQVKIMPQADAVVDRIGEKVFDLKTLNSDNVVELVSTWLQDFYLNKGLTPPTVTYPFQESELKELGKERPIVRRVLKWCCENWGIGDPVVPPDPLHRVEVAFQEQLLALDTEIEEQLEDSGKVSAALRLSFQSVVGEKIGSVLLESVEDINVKAADRGYLSFQLIVKDNDNPSKIAVCVLQESGGKYVSAALKRLIDYEKFSFTRGCLVRSKAVKSNTKGYQYLDTLLNKKGGEWVNLRSQDIQPLLAISAVFRACGEYEVTEKEVYEFIKKYQIAQGNYLINEILSDPSGQIPNSVIDEDVTIDQYNILVDSETSETELSLI